MTDVQQSVEVQVRLLVNDVFQDADPEAKIDVDLANMICEAHTMKFLSLLADVRADTRQQFFNDLLRWRVPTAAMMAEKTCVPWHAVEDALRNPGLFESPTTGHITGDSSTHTDRLSLEEQNTR